MLLFRLFMSSADKKRVASIASFGEFGDSRVSLEQGDDPEG